MQNKKTMSTENGSIFGTNDWSCSVCVENDKQTEATKYCTECRKSFCLSCLSFHNQLLKQHTLVDKDNMVSEVELDLPPLPMETCSTHHHRVVDMYCKEHDVVICTGCVAEDHRSCNGLVYIPKLAKTKEHSEEISGIQAAIIDLQQESKMLQTVRLADIKIVENQKTSILDSIKHTRELINTHLDDLEKRIKTETEKRFNELTKKINEDLTSLQDILSLLDGNAKKLENANTNVSQHFVDIKKAKASQRDGKRRIESMETGMNNDNLALSTNTGVVENIEQISIWKLKEEVQIDTLSLNGIFDIKERKDASTCSIIGSCLMPDGSLVIIDENNKTAKLVGPTFKVADVCSLSCQPSSICRTRPTEVAILLPATSTIQFVNVTNGLSLARAMKVKTDAGSIIAYKAGELFVSQSRKLSLKERILFSSERYEYEHAADVYDISGKFVRGLVLCKSTTADIVLSSSGDQICFASTDGNGSMRLRKSFISHSSCPQKEVSINNIKGVASYNDGSIIVCGYDSNNVVTMVKDGDVMKELLNEKDGIRRPLSVLYDNIHSKLIVSMENNDQIYVYDVV